MTDQNISPECLHAMWQAFLEEVSDKLKVILQDQCFPESLQGDTLKISATSKFTKDFLNSPDRIKEIEEALKTSFNNPAMKAVLSSGRKKNESEHSESAKADVREEHPPKSSKSKAGAASSKNAKNSNAQTKSRRKAEEADTYGQLGFDQLEFGDAAEQEESSAQSRAADIKKSAGYKNNIQPDLTFDNFVCSSNNNLAQNTALAAAQSPGKAYTPLFLYSGVGLGKTHLINAIGNYIMKHHPDLKIIYTSAEQFTNEFVESLRPHGSCTPQNFRKKFRSVDVLLIDDIHFIIGKEGVQEELFQTMDHLYQGHKQIVISSDCPPKQMTNIIARLQSRFLMGMVADIQPPDLETRVAILKQKAINMKVSVQNDALEYIASEFRSNIRELEGALIRTIAYCSIRNIGLSKENVKEALSDLVDHNIKIDATPENIKSSVCEYFSISEQDITGPRRDKKIVKPRQIAMYLCKELITSISYPEIGSHFGGRDHTTVMHAHRKVEEYMSLYKQDIENIKKSLK